MISRQILDKIETLKIADKIDLSRITVISKEPPESLRKKVNDSDMVIYGSGDVKDYYHQPLVVIGLNDLFGIIAGKKR